MFHEVTGSVVLTEVNLLEIILEVRGFAAFEAPISAALLLHQLLGTAVSRTRLNWKMNWNQEHEGKVKLWLPCKLHSL